MCREAILQPREARPEQEPLELWQLMQCRQFEPPEPAPYPARCSKLFRLRYQWQRQRPPLHDC